MKTQKLLLALMFFSIQQAAFADAVLKTVRCGQARADLQVCLYEDQKENSFIQLNYDTFLTYILPAHTVDGPEGQHIQWYMGEGTIKDRPMKIAVKEDSSKDLSATISYISAPNTAWAFVPGTSEFALEYLHVTPR